MKKLITYLKALWGAWGNLQSKDVRHDCRLTVGSPSGLDAKWKQNPFMRFAVVLTLIFTIGIGNAWALTKTEGFETKTAETTYNSTINITTSESDCGISWTIYYGCVSTNSKIADNKSAAMRLYSHNSLGYGYLQSTTAISNLSQVSFKAKAGTGNSGLIKMDVEYSIDNGDNWAYMRMTSSSGSNYASQTPSTSATTYTAYVPSGVTGNFLIRFSINSSSTRPKKPNKGTNNVQLTIDDIVFTYSSSCSYTVTLLYDGDAASHGEFVLKAGSAAGSTISEGGTVANCGSGSTVVALCPQNVDDHYHLEASNITATNKTGSITSDGNGNFLISYTQGSNVSSSVSVTFTEDTHYTVTWMKNGSEYTTTEVYSGEKPTFPSDPSSCDGTSTTFVGWTPTPWSGKLDDVSAKTIYTSGSAMPDVSGPVTYHAVFAKASGSGSGSFELNKDDFGSSYSSEESTLTKLSTNDIGYKQCRKNQTNNTPSGWCANGLIEIRGSNSGHGEIYNKTAISGLTTLRVYEVSGASNLTVYYGTSSKTTENSVSSPFASVTGTESVSYSRYSGSCSTSTITLNYYDVSIPSGNDYFYIYASSGTNIFKITVSYSSVSYSQYLTTCCTPLGSINGSVSWSNPTQAVVSWDNIDHVSSWTVKYKTHAAGDYSTWAGEQTVYTKSTTDDSRKVTITGLTPCTDYDFQIIANPASGYCEKDQTIEDSQTHNWTVTKTGVTNVTAASLSAIPATTCNGFGPITITAATGYALPADITVTNATKSWNSSTGALSISSVTGNVSITITPTCVLPVITADPDDASYYVGDSPDALEVTATLASGTLTYLWKVSTNGGSTWSDAAGTNNAATYSGASLSTASAGTLKFKCIVGNSQGGCTVESAVATITVSNASYFPNGKTIFIQAESTSAWTGDGCVKAWFHTAGGSETAQSTYWLFDATGGDAGKKLFATVVPASGNLPYLDIQRFAANCSDWWNKNGGCSYSDANGSNTVRSTGKHDDSSDGDYVRWNASGVTLDLHGDPSGDDWASSLASFSDQGSGEWTATYNNYAPANAAGESQDFKVKTNYNGWIGNTGTNSNATLSGMHVGSTYNITATLNVISHSLTMSKTFVKGEVSFDLQGHGSAISKLTNVTAGSKISAPSPAPTATGYTFGGWFTDPECTDEWNFATDEVDETMTLYAKWTTNVYTITKTLTNVANAGLPASFTYTGATTTALNSTFTVDATNFFLPSSIAVTMGGTPLTAGTDYTYNNSTGAFTFSRIISGNIVITASATAKLKSIAITTQPTTRKYFAGESFSSAGAVVTATMGDGSTKAVTASTTWTPAGALSAGSQTITASYTENGINQTTTTTVDVYSVTVKKVNEDGDEVSADGVSAGWTVGTKALAASASGASKYVFKQWDVTGATAASTSSANTTLSNPTANVVVNAVFYKPRVVKWSVNGNDSYATGGPTTTVAYNGTISAVPDAPDDDALSCANKFMGWSTKNAGATPKTTSYYDDLFTNASGYTANIIDATKTFYAVFAEVDEGNWTLDYSEEEALRNSTSWGSYGTAYNYTASDGGTWTVKANKNSGMQINNGKNSSIKIPNCSGDITSIVVTGTNKTVRFSQSDYDGSTYGDIEVTGSDAYTQTLDFTGKSISAGYIVPKTNANAITRIVVNYGSTSNYVTECDATKAKVTYDLNGGTGGCATGLYTKDGFTVCNTAVTRTGYTFSGWNDGTSTYAAGAAYTLTTNVTFTAQWTPVEYTITYNLDGGTNNIGNPASYTIESSDITLLTPTKTAGGYEYDFTGWTDDDDSDAPITTIASGSTGNKHVTATWAQKKRVQWYVGNTVQWTTFYASNGSGSLTLPNGGTPPSVPPTCGSKVFVGWTSDTPWDGETDTEPTVLFKAASGTVSDDANYYAVWADEHSEEAEGEIFSDAFNISGTDEVTSRDGWSSLSKLYGGSGSIRFSTGGGAGTMTLVKTGLGFGTTVTEATITFKIKKYGSDGSGVLSVSSNFSDATTTFSKDGGKTTSTSAQYSTTDGANWTTCTCTVGSISASTDIILEGQTNSRVYVKDFSIEASGTTYTYDKYAIVCCNDPELEFGQTRYSLIREDLHGNTSAAYSTIELTYSSSSSGAIRVWTQYDEDDNPEHSTKTAWQYTGANTWGTSPTTGGSAATASSHAYFEITDAANGKATFYVKNTAGNTQGQGTYRIALHQAANGGYCETVTYCWIDVTLRDKFVDNVNGNTFPNADGHGPGGAAVSTPAENTRDADKDDDCHETTRRLVGWVKETDMDTWYGSSSDRTRDLDDKKDDAKLVAPGATITTSGATWYAVWGEEVTE